MLIHFYITENQVCFQKDSSFYINEFNNLKRSIKDKLGKVVFDDNLYNFSKYKLSEKENIYIDIRANYENLELIIKSIESTSNLYDLEGNVIIKFYNSEKNLYTNKKTYFNPYNVYNHLLKFTESYISPSAKVLPGAIIVGKCYIGDNCIIGNNVLIRNSYISEDCIIGYNTEINRSYIGKNCTFHTNFIGNSIVGDNCNFGYITCTTVIRLDGGKIKITSPKNNYETDSNKFGAIIEMGCNFGANITLMPGSYIGQNSIIHPYCLIKKRIDRNSYVKTHFSKKLKVRKVKNSLRNISIFRDKLVNEIANYEKD